ncbi:mechanosensitive ion channel family protein [Croceicoccus bisphenolivorans]|uniref:mechanosensitive ion channel family protein n=1 Tax=Croceicoccus bisphenolivorans TaxID=1783232 RepID=UPI0009EDAAE1|nr:mechanosensitive ion channel domain-containing protein [Croceicoccus bisphenolivorans]
MTVAAETPVPDATASDAVASVTDKVAATAAQAAQAVQDNDPLKGADQIKDAVAEQSMTIAQIIEHLDSLGVTVGDTRFSVWTALVVVMVIAGVIVFARLASKGAHAMLKRMTRLSPTQSLLMDKVLTMVVWAFAILIGIDLLGVDLTAFAVFSGAFGLAIGFGLQKTFGNLIAGMILLMDRSIKPGDVIAVTDMAGNETFGQIRKIGIRAISVTTRDEREYLIPNENLMINQVENWSFSSRNVRIQVPVGVGYHSDIHKAEELMLEAAASCKRVLELPAPSVWLSGYGDSSVDFVIHCWIRDPELGVGNIRSEVLKKLWDLFHEHDIEIPFPQRDINLRGNAQFDQLIAAISQRLEENKAAKSSD